MKVVWTRKASRHLRAGYDYWASESSKASADTLLDRIFSAVERLERFPETGRPGRVPGTRELVIVPTPFLVAYRIRRSNIEILSLLHGARKWPEQF
jgi:toxin ParE1/3/4